MYHSTSSHIPFLFNLRLNCDPCDRDAIAILTRLDCDLDATLFGKQTIFDFARHRRIEHYARITAQTGVIPPPQG